MDTIESIQRALNGIIWEDEDTIYLNEQRLAATFARIQLNVDAAGSQGTLATETVNLLRTARRTLQDQYRDSVEILKWSRSFSTSYISFAEFLITHGDQIHWEECVVWIEDLYRKAQELSAKASDRADVFEKLRRELGACKGSLSEVLRSAASSTDRRWYDTIKDFLGIASQKNQNHELVDTFDNALKDMIAHQRLIAQFWKDQEEALAALNSPFERAVRFKPERLRDDIEGWKIIETAFSTAISLLPASADPSEASIDTTTIVPTPITPYLNGLVTNAELVRNTLSTFYHTVVVTPITKLHGAVSKTLSQIRASVLSKFHELRFYLQTCVKATQTFQSFFDYRLLYGSDVAQASISNSIVAVLQAALDGAKNWEELRNAFKKGKRQISIFCSEHGGQIPNPSLNNPPETPSDRDHDRIKAYIEGAVDNIHTDVIDYDIALRSTHQYHRALSKFWRDQESHLRNLIVTIQSGQKPADDELKRGMDLLASFPMFLKI